jgi:hypothetical protein
LGREDTAYAFSIGLTVGINGEHTLLGSEMLATPQDFAASLLRILGYSESNGYFEYAQARSKAIDVGLFTVFESAAVNSNGSTLRAEAVICISNALITYLKDSDVRLIDKLVEQKSISRQAADAFVKSVSAIYHR